MDRRRFTAGLASSALATAMPGCRGAGRAIPTVPQRPAASYDAAMRAAFDLIGRDAADPKIEREALPLVYTHGGRAERAVILFHGFTNCPKQFDELARGFFARGCNVFVPRLPLHGHANRLTHDLDELTVADVVACANDAAWLARGLGRRVSALGLSLGGAMALWLAQTQTLDLAVPVAPFLAPVHISEFLSTLAARAAYVLPSIYFWWDSSLKERSLPLYAYPGYPSHAMAELIFFGNAILAAAAASKPLANNCVLVTNVDDNAVNNGVSSDLIATWNRTGASYREHVLSGLGPPRHDIIDPTTYPQARQLVYPTLERIVLDDGR